MLRAGGGEKCCEGGAPPSLAASAIWEGVGAVKEWEGPLAGGDVVVDVVIEAEGDEGLGGRGRVGRAAGKG